MTCLEQQMKEFLDGKFFHFAPDGQIKCREVHRNYLPSHFKDNYSKDYMAKGGKQRGFLRWSGDQIEWLRANMKLKTVNQCAAILNFPYHRVYDKILILKREEKWKARQ